MGAVNLFVICDDRWRSRGEQSCYRGVPVIDTTILFAAMKRVRTMAVDHAMVAVEIAGVPQFDDAGVEMLERVEFEEDDEDDDGIRSIKLKTGMEYDDGELDLVVKIHDQDVGKTHPLSVTAPPNSALALCGPGVHTSKGYAFSFDVKCAADSSRDVPRILHGFVNRSSGGGSGSITRKRKAITMES